METCSQTFENTMNDEIRNEMRQTVDSAENAWIVLHSKSIHPGRVYYFNTVTKEAVWNLCDADLEKARLAEQMKSPQGPDSKGKSRGQLIQKQDNTKTRFHETPSSGINIFQKQQQLGDMLHQTSGLNAIQTQQQSNSSFSNIPMNSLATFDLNAMNNPINAFNIISTPYNPNGWPIQRPQQIFITPTIPIVNPSQSSLNVAYNQLIRHDQAPASRFNRLQNRRNRLYHTKNKYGGQRKFNKLQMDKYDLRQQLYLKRRLNALQGNKACEDVENNKDEVETGIIGTNSRRADVSSYIADMIEEEFNSHTKNNSSVLDGNSTDTQFNRTPPELSLKRLKCLAPSNANPHVWYIVSDLNVLLEEFNFLNVMTDSDEHCHLMIPETVMSQLKDYIASSNNVAARRIFHGLSQQIESDSTFVAGEPNQDYGDTITDPILKTCLELLEENYHAILLTNNRELLKYKKFIKVNIFTVEEAKSIVKYSPSQCNSQRASEVHSVLPTRKAAAPHEIAFKGSVSRKTPVVETIIKDTTLGETDLRTEPKENPRATMVTMAVSPVKHTADASIQTETVTIINPDTNIDTEIDKRIIENINTSTASSNETTQKPISNPTTTTALSGPPAKRREIKLKRSFSNQHPELKSTGISKEKKPFRWRRKRNLCASVSQPQPNNEKPCGNTSENVVKVASINQQTNTVSHESEKPVEIPNSKHTTEKISNSDEITESRESSIVCVDTSRRNITIEETSTSGIISNTESNVDVDIEYNKGNQVLEEPHDEDITEHTSNVMIEIDSERMEESLKTKCEEWVSRFIQIMEEVLSEVLHKEPMFSNIAMPPPWTLHEAAQCIGKYCNDAAVKCVTAKLSSTLFHLSNNAGKITMNMTPKQYMELYSCGVSLLNAIKAITTNCEDIQIAEDSLQELLLDIKNPYGGLNDSIIERQQVSPSIQVSHIVNEHTGSESENEKNIGLVNQEPAKYNLRSRIRRLIVDAQRHDIKIIRKTDVKTNFLSSLNLQQVTSPPNDITENNLADKSHDLVNEGTQVSLSSEDASDDVTICDNTLNTPTIVQKYSKCAELEKRLKKELNISTNDQTNDTNDEYLDYEEDSEYTSVECQSDDFDMSNNDEELSDPNITQALDTSDIDVSGNLVASSPKTVDSANDCNNTFKFMICLFLQEVRQALNDVKVLCDKCYEEIKNPQLPEMERNELNIQVENAHSHIVGLCTSLKSMLDRDPNAPFDNMQTALQSAGIDISDIDKHLVLEYWNTIDNCKEHADIFLYSIREIMTALKTNNE